MSAGRNETALLAGAGLAGALVAVQLARAGYRVRVFEHRPDPREGARSRARSINLAISARGIHALESVGLAEQILERAVPMRGRMIHGVSGGLAFQPYGTQADQAIHSVSRLGLNLALIEAAAAEPNVELNFGVRAVDVDLDAPALELEDAAGGERTRVEGDFVVGADGAFSAVRGRLQRLDRFDFSQTYLRHGYKELTIPPAEDGGFRMEPNALHIWPRGGFMMIALPNRDGSYTCTLFWPFAGEHGFDALRDRAEIERYFQRTVPDAVPLMPDLAEEYLRNPVSSLVTVRCRPWHRRDRAVLVGDACHAVVPFYGQGANAAFEDCVVLERCLREGGFDRAAAFAEYDRLRKENVDALADLAIANFLEMRDHVASPAFRLKKKAEKLLHRLLPFWFVPLYTLVTFTRTPYAAAREKARRQWAVVRGAAVFIAMLLLALLLWIAWP